MSINMKYLLELKELDPNINVFIFLLLYKDYFILEFKRNSKQLK